MPVSFGKIVQERRVFFDPPPEGTHQGVLAEVSACYRALDRFDPNKGEKDYVDLTFELNKPNPKGGNYKVREQYAASMNEKANLLKVVMGLRGSGPTPAEIEKYKFVDPEDGLTKWKLEDFLRTLVGMNAFVSVTHNRDSRGFVYAHINGVIQLPDSVAPMETTDPEPDPWEGTEADV